LALAVLGVVLSASCAWTSDLKESTATTEWFLVPQGPHVVLATQTLPAIAPADAARAMELHSMLNRAVTSHVRDNPDRSAAQFLKSEEVRMIRRDLHAALIEIYRKSGIDPREYSVNLVSRTFVRWTAQPRP
jgi:hypothetical protein